jgi:alginate O-acetyltransferase complex protein AlgI
VLLHTFPFLVLFLPLVVLVHAALRARLPDVWARSWLLLASAFFYIRAPGANLPLLLASILCNWALSRQMIRASDDGVRRALFLAGLVGNIVVLFLFKYVHLFLDTVVYFHGPRMSFPDWGFPFGVSFFTLTQIMYLVDAFPKAPASPAARKLFRGVVESHSLLDHATFVMLFPYVTAGPLVKARSVVEQLRTYTKRESRTSLACRGLYLFSMGLAKKLVFGDAFGAIADVGFARVSDYSFAEAWTFCIAALLHLYFDFSGYSDMAVGSAWMLGIDIPQNFNAPLRSTSIREFWQRWHISLSNFINEYLYTPILRAIGRPGMAASLFATVVAMMIAALWHGPAWTFVAWGLSHGIALSTNQVWKRAKLHMPDWLGWLVTFIFLTSTITLLRAHDLTSALHMSSRLLPHANLLGFDALSGLLPASPTILLRPIGLGLVAAFFFKSSMDYAREFKPSVRLAAACAFLLAISFMAMNSAPARPFIYAAF